MSGCAYFVSIPKNENDPRYPAEIINLCSINRIQVFSEDKLIVYFFNGDTKNYYGDRAQSLIEALTLVNGN